MKFVLKINLCIFDILGSKVLKRTFVRVVKSCPGDPGSGPRVPNVLYVIFKMIYFNIIHFTFIKHVSSTNIQLVSKYRRFPACYSLVSVSSLLNSDACRLALRIKDMPSKHPCSTTALELVGSLCRQKCIKHLAIAGKNRSSNKMRPQPCINYSTRLCQT